MIIFYTFGCLMLVSVVHASVFEVECEYESDYHNPCETNAPPVVCTIIDVIVSDNFTTLKIVNYDEFEFNFIKIRQSRFHAFPCELIEQLPNIRTISVYRAEMKEIKDFSFANASSLQELNIYHNEISEITENAFRGATALKEMSLNRNKIKSIHPKAFETLTKLIWLDLTENLLEVIHEETFASLTNLQHLFLGECQIKTIAVTAFVKNVNLSTLHLDENHLEHLELDLASNYIKTIYLHINKLKKIVLNAKRPSGVKVREVYASFNKLTEVDVEPSLGLKILGLKNNKIQSLQNISQLSTLTVLELTDNPITDLSKIGQFPNLTRLSLGKTKVELKPNMFTSLPNLKSLHLSEMSLENVDVGWFKGLSKLGLLNLGENRLRDLNYKELSTELPSLRGMMVNNNSFNCSFLEEMLGYLKNKTSIRILDADADNTTETVDKIMCNNRNDKKSQTHVFRNVLITLGVFITTGFVIFVFATVAKKHDWKIASYMNYRSYSNMRTNNGPNHRLVNENQ